MSSEIEENLDYKTVFTIKHSEIPPGITQCKEHSWVKYSDNEVKCTKCPTINIINPEDMQLYVR